MNLPRTPKKDEPVIHFAKEVITWMRANTLNHVKGGRVKRSPNGTTVEVINEQRERDITPEQKEALLSLLNHPWKVTPNGDDTVTIASGKIKSLGLYLGAGDGASRGYVKYDGTSSFTVTTTGYIYAEISYTDQPNNTLSLTDENLFVDSVIADGSIAITNTNLTPGYGNYLPSGKTLAFPIALVTLSGGVVTLDEQIEDEHIEISSLTYIEL